MKGFAFLVFAVVGFVYATNVLTPPPTCPPPDPNGGAVHLANPDDCSTFYVCNGLIPVLMNCINDTWFNPEVGVCDWPTNIPDGICMPPTPAPEGSGYFENY